jgi:hypothetical protein
VTGFQSSFAPLTDGQVATVANNDACVLAFLGCTITAVGIVNPHPASYLSIPTTVVYAGAAPGMVAGVTQFNLQVGTPATANDFALTLNGSSVIGFVAVSPN